MSAANLRLQQDFALLNAAVSEKTYCNIAKLEQESLRKWYVTIHGPEATPYEGGLFKIAITFPDGYPEQPPLFKFVTKIFHPNVYNDGQVCVDILGPEWRPDNDLFIIITEAISLFLDEPNPDSAANVQAADLYVNHNSDYQNYIRQLVKLTNSCETMIYSCSTPEPPKQMESSPRSLGITRLQIARIRLDQDFHLLMERVDGNVTMNFDAAEFKANVTDLQMTGLLLAVPKRQLPRLEFAIKFSTDYPHGAMSIIFNGKPTSYRHPYISESGCFSGDQQLLFGNWQKMKRPSRLASLLTAFQRSMLLSDEIEPP